MAILDLERDEKKMSDEAAGEKTEQRYNVRTRETSINLV